MPRLTIWNSGRKSNDYKFTDRVISEFFGASGTALYIHKYLGTRSVDENGNPILDGNGKPVIAGPQVIQDVVFLENRDRAYDANIIELRGTYNVADNDLDLKQFGLFLTGDTLFIETHLNDMVKLVGRRVYAGDVIELPHLRDDFYDIDAPAVNKFYVVQDALRASDGYSSTWYPHIWRLKCVPMTDSQEYQDILDQQAQNPFGLDQGKLGDLLSTIATELDINEQIVDEAIIDVKRRNFETQQFYVLGGDETTGQYPWIYAGDAAPPNGAIPTGSGTRFPTSPTNGDYFIRTDYEPRALFQYNSSVWRLLEQDYRMTEWSAAHRILKTFIDNNTTTTMPDGLTFPEKQPLWKSVKPRADFT